MKIRFVYLSLMIILLTGCTGQGNTSLAAQWKPAGEDQRMLVWSKVKSPITGRCYEVMERGQGSSAGMMAMSSEVPCS
jgi:hypothetical protein